MISVPLESQIDVISASKHGSVIDSHVTENKNYQHEHGLSGWVSYVLTQQQQQWLLLNRDPLCNGQSANNTTSPSTTINTSVSEPTDLSSHNKSIQDSNDYSTVLDTLVSSSSGRMQSVSKKCPPLLKHSKLAANKVTAARAHPFSSEGTTKAVNKKRPFRAAPPIPIAKHNESDSRPIGEREHSYAHIVDGLSPPEDGDSAVFVDSTSPPHTAAAKKHKSTSKTTSNPTTNSTSTTTTTVTIEELESSVYSTPIPDGIKNYRRMTASKNTDAATSKAAVTAATITKEKYIRPKSALGLYPPLDDIYTSSCNSSPSSVRKKIDKSRPVSSHYN